MFQFFSTLRRDVRDRGATAVEYALMVTAIAAVVIGVAFGLGRIVQNAIGQTCSSISTSATPNLSGTNC